MEETMKTIIKMTTATIFAAGLFSLATPAFATTPRDVIVACDKNPSCTMSISGNILVAGVKGGKSVACSVPKGPCVVLRTGPTRFNHIGEGGGQHTHEAQGSNGNGNGNGNVGGDGGGQIQ
jgi:hypothetical protein